MITVCGIEPPVGLCADSTSLLGILSLALSLSALPWLTLMCVLSLSLKINKLKKKRKEEVSAPYSASVPREQL